jgi:hypothetical protein
MGSGPLVVTIHGFPDFWYSWRAQMEGLADKFQVVAIDQRGYKLSDKPEGARTATCGCSCVIAGHPSLRQGQGHRGGARLGRRSGVEPGHERAAVRRAVIILNLPHLRGLNRELARNPEQQKNSQYAQLSEGRSEKNLTPEGLAGWVKDAEAKPKYIEAFKKSSFVSMTAYHQRNYPRQHGRL